MKIINISVENEKNMNKFLKNSKKCKNFLFFNTFQKNLKKSYTC